MSSLHCNRGFFLLCFNPARLCCSLILQFNLHHHLSCFAIALVPFVVPPLFPLLPPHVEIMLVPQVGIGVFVALLILQNGPVDTFSLLLPPICSAAAAVLLVAATISLFLLLRLLIILVNEK